MVEGTERLRARFKAVPQKIIDEVANALEAEAIKIVAEMKRLVPVGNYSGGGALRDSIGWTWGDAPKGSISVGKVRNASDKFGRINITIYAGTRDKSLGNADAFYARFQEFGTIKMAANPFFFPAWRANRTRARRAAKRAISKAIKRA
jgi:HK97 gp10 family phage protein